MEEIAHKIRELREQTGWSQTRLAHEAGITASAVNMIESGKRVPTLIVARKIAKALRVSISELTETPSIKDSNKEAHVFFRHYGDLNDLSEENRKFISDMIKKLKDK